MLGEPTLLTAWERGLRQPPTHWAVGVVTELGLSPDAPAETLSLPDLNAVLLDLRRRLFGTRLECVCDCPHCAERLEWQVDLDTLDRASDGNLRAACGPALFSADIGDIRVRFRLPTAQDVRAARDACGETAELVLVRRCIVEAHRGGAALMPESLDAELLAPIADRIEQAATAAEIRFELRCPGCTGVFSRPLDVIAFLQEEMNDWARRTLRGIHRLAAAYGWTEEEILRLSPRRREAYLSMIDV
jgi:hypothetical protein